MKQSRKTMGRSWASSDQGSTQPSILSPAIPKLLLPLSFSVPVSGLGLVLPPASYQPHTRAHRWQCPKQLWHRALSGRLSRAGHNPSTLPYPSVCISLPPSWAHTALPSAHKCPRWQSPLAEGAKGGQPCAKPIVVHPGLPLPSSKKPPALRLGGPGWRTPRGAPSHGTRICLCPCAHSCKSGQWMVPAKWVSRCWLGVFFICAEELLQEWEKS